MLSVGLRVRQYRAMLGIVGAVPGRWPRLFDLIKQHKQLFITWSTLAPLLLALSLMAVQMLASRFLFPDASMPPFGLTVGRLAEHVLFAILIGFLARSCWLAMFTAHLWWVKWTDRGPRNTSIKRNTGSNPGRRRSCAFSRWATSILAAWLLLKSASRLRRRHACSTGICGGSACRLACALSLGSHYGRLMLGLGQGEPSRGFEPSPIETPFVTCSNYNR